MPGSPASALDSRSRALAMLALIVAGETMFVLPFVIVRVFRTTFLDVFGLSNLQLGSAFSVYGAVAMVSYFLGGPLADRIAPRRLIAIALAITALGGGVFASVPAIGVLRLLYAFWGVSSILLFWAALIRAAREWGGDDTQGRAYGLLDGGRGLLAAVLASLAVSLFASLLPADVQSATLAQRRAALAQVISAGAVLTMLAAAFAWFALPRGAVEANRGPRTTFGGVRAAARLPGVWLQAVVIVCAYFAYKATDNFGLYAYEVLGYDDVAAARLGSLAFWMRPLAALGAGLLADRVQGSRLLAAGFALLMAGALVLASAAPSLMRLPAMFVTTVAVTSLAIYALRAIYHAVMNEARVPLAVTGSAVGLVSVIGYLPDVFAGPLIGWLLDRHPGALGHRQVFLVVAALALVGLLATLAFRKATRAPRDPT